MDERVARLTTPEECEQFIKNVAAQHPDLALAAKRRAIQLKAGRSSAKTAAEREAIEAVYAYEAVLAERRGKNVRATRTWQMIKRHGIIGAIERAVDREDDPSGYLALVTMNMMDLSFESIVVRHENLFSKEAVDCCKRRLNRYQAIHREDQC